MSGITEKSYQRLGWSERTDDLVAFRVIRFDAGILRAARRTTSVRRYTGEPISLDLKDADIRDVLLTFSKLARLNMVIDPDVRGSVTVRLEDVPWDQALEVILKVNGLGYVLEGNIVRVGSPPGL